MYALACLVAAEHARRDAKQFWSELADRGAPRKEIDQAREEYSRFETMARECEAEFRVAEKYRVAVVVEGRGAGQTFRAHQPKPSPSSVEKPKPTTKIYADVEKPADALNTLASERFQDKVLEENKAKMQIQAANEARKLRALEAHQRLQLAEAGKELEALQAKQSQLLKQFQARQAEYAALEEKFKSEMRRLKEAGLPADDEPSTPKAAPAVRRRKLTALGIGRCAPCSLRRWKPPTRPWPTPARPGSRCISSSSRTVPERKRPPKRPKPASSISA